MTNKQQAFVNEYIIDSNGTRAAIAAGYSAKTAAVKASTLLNEPEIKEALAEIQKQSEQRTQITVDMIINQLWDESLGLCQDTNSKSRVAALTEIAKIRGYHVDKKELSGSLGISMIAQAMIELDEENE